MATAGSAASAEAAEHHASTALLIMPKIVSALKNPSDQQERSTFTERFALGWRPCRPVNTARPIMLAPPLPARWAATSFGLRHYFVSETMKRDGANFPSAVAASVSILPWSTTRSQGGLESQGRRARGSGSSRGLRHETCRVPHGACLRGGVIRTRIRGFRSTFRHHAACPRGAVFPDHGRGNIAPRRQVSVVACMHWGEELSGSATETIAPRRQAPRWRKIVLRCPCPRAFVLTGIGRDCLYSAIIVRSFHFRHPRRPRRARIIGDVVSVVQDIGVSVLI